MTTRLSWQHAILALMCVCTIATTGIAIRESIRSRATAAAKPSPTQVPQETWIRLLNVGHRIGPDTALVKIVEFADFQCPWCARSQADLDALRKSYPNDLAIYYLHYPLQGHQHAMAAAQAAECALSQDRFEPMQRMLYDKHAEFGRIAWEEIASAAGIPDLSTFETCMTANIPESIVESKRIADQIDVFATPTFLINGWKLVGVPSLDEFREMVERAKQGQLPVDVDPAS